MTLWCQFMKKRLIDMTIEEKNYINLLEKIGSDVHPALEQQYE